MTQHKTAEERAREIVQVIIGTLDVEIGAGLITAAITAAEREAIERCAEVADRRASQEPLTPGDAWDDGWMRASRVIADDIRALVKEGE